MANEEKKYTEQVSVRWYGYIVLILTILFFSGIFSSIKCSNLVKLSRVLELIALERWSTLAFYI